ncbi:conserved hypothetical protein [Ricinus communis]|uniref:Defensin-like domain-containing protein n=1 Tax=Ricinus communis TaxID=3988 RepID=B9S210_RICCO|nr:conserved hypothetical protein [Ricinus communis]
MAFTNVLIVCLTTMAIIISSVSSGNLSASNLFMAHSEIGVERAVDPFCYKTCAASYRDSQCKSDCVAKNFKNGKCLSDQRPGLIVCCCSP